MPERKSVRLCVVIHSAGRHFVMYVSSANRGQRNVQVLMAEVLGIDVDLAALGRMAAIVDLRGFQFSGLLVWWFWLGAHIVLGQDGSVSSPR